MLILSRTKKLISDQRPNRTYAPKPTKGQKPLTAKRPKEIAWIQNKKTIGLITVTVVLGVLLIAGAVVAYSLFGNATSGTSGTSATPGELNSVFKNGALKLNRR